MKTSIGLVLMYFVFQILGGICGMILSAIYLLMTRQDFAFKTVQDNSLAPALLLGALFMTIYLWRTGYISKERKTWSSVSVGYLLLSVILYFSFILAQDFLFFLLPPIPDILESTFDILQSGWLGIITIALLGPLLEELLFRGAVTRILLQKYSPVKAILLSALIFGLFHINPAQVVSAGLMGIVLAWIYYKTSSLIPCILIHVLNNSLSVYLNLKYPEVETLNGLVEGNNYYLIVAGAVIMLIVTLIVMNSMTRPQKEEEKMIHL